MSRPGMLLRSIGIAALVVGALVVSSSVLALAVQGPARGAPTPVFTLAFDALTPGVPESRTDSFTLERAATLVEFAWLERTGIMTDADLTVKVCDSTSTCLDPVNLNTGAPVAAGRVHVTVTTLLTNAAPAAGSGSVVGRLSFIADDHLSATGSDPVMWMAAGAAAIVLGVLLIAVVARRRAGRRIRRDT